MKAQFQEVLKAVVGSQAYGLNHEGSDTDYLGVTLVDSHALWGLYRFEETKVTKDPDCTMHELGKFCALALKGNPTVNELLWLEDEQYVTRTRVGQQLIDLRRKFLSVHTRNAYFGYITGQVKRFDAHAEGNPKLVRHAMRLAIQLDNLLNEGKITPRLTTTERKLVWDSTPESVQDFVALVESKPWVYQQQPDFEAVQDWLLDTRARHAVGLI